MAEKILGMEVEKLAADKYVVAKKDVESYYNDNGVTKEIKKNIKKVETDLMEASMNFAGKKVVKTKKPVTVQLGSGDGAMSVKVFGKREFPKTEIVDGKMTKSATEKTIKYGGAQVSIKKKVPSVFLKDDGCLAKVNAEIEKAIG